MISMPLAQIAQALGGNVVGRRVAFPPPGHSRIDRSAVLFIDDAAPEGFYVHTFSPADDPLQVRDYVRERLGLPNDGWRRAAETRPDPARETARRRAVELDEVDRAGWCFARSRYRSESGCRSGCPITSCCRAWAKCRRSRAPERP